MKKIILMALAIVTCFALVACGKQEEEKNNNVETNVVDSQDTTNSSNEIEENLDDVREAISGMELYSDDTKFVFEMEDNTKAIYYHDGNKITGYEIRVGYDSHELAELAKIEYEKEPDENAETVRVDGNTLVVEFGPAEYEETSLDEIKAAYSFFQILQVD